MTKLFKFTSVVSLSAASLFGATPDLTPSQALLNAERAWGALRADGNIQTIVWKDLGKCNDASSMIAFTPLGRHEIWLNTKCKALHSNPELLQTAINHEYGHVLHADGRHSNDPTSVMYAQLRYGQTIKPEDQTK